MLLRGMEGWHLVIIAGLVTVLFGARKMPDAARSIGQSLRIFKSEMKAAGTDSAADCAPVSATDSASVSATDFAAHAPAPAPAAAPQAVEARVVQRVQQSAAFNSAAFGSASFELAADDQPGVGAAVRSGSAPTV